MKYGGTSHIARNAKPVGSFELFKVIDLPNGLLA